MILVIFQESITGITAQKDGINLSTTTYFAQYGSHLRIQRIPDTVPTGPNAYRLNGGFSGDRVGRWFGFLDGATDYMYWSHNKPVELGYDEKVGFL